MSIWKSALIICSGSVLFSGCGSEDPPFSAMESGLKACVDDHGYQRVEDVTSLDCYDRDYGIHSMLGVGQFYRLNNLKVLLVDTISSDEFGINQLESLETLEIFDYSGRLDVTEMPNLKKLVYRAGSLETIDTSKNPQLEYLEFHSYTDNYLDTSANAQLQTLIQQCPPRELQSWCVIADSDLSMNKNLKYVDLSGGEITSVNLSGLAQLEYLDLSHNDISFVDLAASHNLRHLDLSYNEIDTLQLGHMIKLEYLNTNSSGTKVEYVLPVAPLMHTLLINRAGLTSIDLSIYTQLQVVDLSYNQFDASELSNLSDLTHVKLSNLALESIDISSWDSELAELDVSGNALRELDLTNQPLIEKLNARDNQIVDIQFSEASQLQTLLLSVNPIQTLDISYLTKLESLHLIDTQIQSILYPTSVERGLDIQLDSPNQYICYDTVDVVELLDRNIYFLGPFACE